MSVLFIIITVVALGFVFFVAIVGFSAIAVGKKGRSTWSDNDHLDSVYVPQDYGMYRTGSYDHDGNETLVFMSDKDAPKSFKKMERFEGIDGEVK